MIVWIAICSLVLGYETARLFFNIKLAKERVRIHDEAQVIIDEVYRECDQRFIKLRQQLGLPPREAKTN